MVRYKQSKAKERTKISCDRGKRRNIVNQTKWIYFPNAQTNSSFCFDNLQYFKKVKNRIFLKQNNKNISIQIKWTSIWIGLIYTFYYMPCPIYHSPTEIQSLLDFYTVIWFSENHSNMSFSSWNGGGEADSSLKISLKLTYVELVNSGYSVLQKKNKQFGKSMNL